ncbi:MAG TPA: CdvA-like protein, partial [Candidatus Binatus sp.]|nr:CdvA-like protein [Candidatus Binatus sp.]
MSLERFYQFRGTIGGFTGEKSNMGLNDLTLEKLIGEINGYKQKMQSLYEDYGHTAQELQDRINVLGYSLNEHLKDVKDSIASTPPRLLTLETKYVSGEVNEHEYRVQKNEFKILLQRNLTTIEDIKNMITVLSQIEARPLGPAEIRQAPQFPVSSPLSTPLPTPR